MPFTLRPSVGADMLLTTDAAGLLSLSLYSSDGSAVILTRALLGGSYIFVENGGAIGTPGVDTLIGSAQNDVVFWDPSTLVQIVNDPEFITPFSNNSATAIEIVALGDGDDILTLSHNASAPGNPGLYTQSMTAYGGNGNDILWLAAGSDVVFGDAGDDLIGGQGGNDTLSGGAGLDTLFGGDGADLLLFNADFGPVALPVDVRIWTGEGASPSFVRLPGAGSNLVWSRDIFNGGAGHDTVRLTSGNDLLLMNTQDLSIGGVTQAGGVLLVDVEVIDAGDGNDIVSVNDAANGVALATPVTIIGGAGQDLLVGGAGNDVIIGGNYSGAMGGGDRDTLYGGDGDDLIYGETTTDPQTLDGGFDTIFGGGGNDTVFAGAGNDTAYGGDARDTLYGGAGDDMLYGGNRADTLFGDAGTDRLFGDAGDDTLYYSGDALIAVGGGDDGVVFWTGEGALSSATHVFSDGIDRSFDTFDGGTGTDTVLGNNGANLLVANGGDIFIDGVAQAASPGHLAGIEVILMGGGADVVLLNDNTGATPWASAVTVFGGVLGDLIVAGNGDDRLVGGNPDGGAAADTFDADTLYGGGGNDVIFGDRDNRENSGEGGNDTLYGGSGDDTLFGDAGADRLYGGVGIDTLYGGQGNDQLYASADAELAGETLVLGWDGTSFSFPEVVLAPGTIVTQDGFHGGERFDTVDLRTISTPGGRVYFGVPAGGTFGGFLSGVELILAGAGADVINLVDARDQFMLEAYAEDVTIVGGGDSDVVFSGAGADVIYGDHAAGTLSRDDGNDTLFGGAGNDTIYGDSVDGQRDGAAAGNDTLYGGAGNDLLFGGGGDDVLFDVEDSTLIGGDGADLIALRLASVGASDSVIVAGEETAGDGADRVFVTGYYNAVTADLGAGNDLFISLATDHNGEGNSGLRVDRVAGGTGDDVISTWYGNDTLFGGQGNDALWGGPGQGFADQPGDILYGGPGTDYLYPGEGDSDFVYGGPGVDYYYWSRLDGRNDQIFDELRGTDTAGQVENYLVVFAGYDEQGALAPGQGVFEADGILSDNDGDDMVHVYDLDGAGPGTLWRLEILQGDGQGNYVDFDQRDISTIALWNHDAGPGTQVITLYHWDGQGYALA